MKSPELALFDFDGTITTRDSFTLFLRQNSSTRFDFMRTVLSLAPQITLFFAGKYPNEQLKTTFLARLFPNISEKEFNHRCERFYQQTIPTILRPRAIEEIERHHSAGTRMLIVTASPRLLVEPFATAHNMQIIGTEMEFDENGIFTGRLAGRNCRRKEKVRRIKEKLNLDDFSTIHCYGDSEGDTEMLQLASKGCAHYKEF